MKLLEFWQESGFAYESRNFFMLALLYLSLQNQSQVGLMKYTCICVVMEHFQALMSTIITLII